MLDERRVAISGRAFFIVWCLTGYRVNRQLTLEIPFWVCTTPKAILGFNLPEQLNRW